MVPCCRAPRPGPPVRGRVQGAPGSPTSSLLGRPPTPGPQRPRLRCPWPVASRAAGACAGPLRPTPRARANVSCVGDGAPALRTTGPGARRGEGLPGAGTVLCLRAMVAPPAGAAPRLAHGAPRTLWPARHAAPWASGQRRGCGAAGSLAHPGACRRLAEAMAGPGARRAPGAGGLTLGRAGVAPAGRQTKCQEGIFSACPCDQPCLVALHFLLCCRCCQALLRIFSFLSLWTQSPIAQRHLSTSFAAQSARLPCLAAWASPETITAGSPCPTAARSKTTCDV
jgi:hypothetical protein